MNPYASRTTRLRSVLSFEVGSTKGLSIRAMGDIVRVHIPAGHRVTAAEVERCARIARIPSVTVEVAAQTVDVTA
jgi:hypothetical protein